MACEVIVLDANDQKVAAFPPANYAEWRKGWARKTGGGPASSVGLIVQRRDEEVHVDSPAKLRPLLRIMDAERAMTKLVVLTETPIGAPEDWQEYECWGRWKTKNKTTEGATR